MILPLTLLTLIVALVAKDTFYLDDVYVLRGIAQGLCLLVGSAWIFMHMRSTLLIRYWPALFYLFALTVSITAAAKPAYVALQVVSLVAVVLFFIAYFETQRKTGYRSELYVRSTIFSLGLVVILSLPFAWLYPHLAYEILYDWEVRFRGLFAKAGMLGAASGLVIGLAWFGLQNRWAKMLIIVLAAVCLALTLSRTFWVALAVAWATATWLVKPRLRRWLAFIAVAGAALTAVLFMFDLTLNNAVADRVLRADSIANLSGRVTLWEEGLSAFKRSPLIGYGFTLGSDGLDAPEGQAFSDDALSIADARDRGKKTLHSGYLQSVLDAGLMGTVFYTLTMFVSVGRLWRFAREPRFAPQLFAIVYLLVANLAENVVYSASVYVSIFFWGIAIFALSLPRSVRTLSSSQPLGPTVNT
jgi:O-antigen ligase